MASESPNNTSLSRSTRSRRSFLAAAGVAGLGGIAGCMGGDGNGDGTAQNGEDDPIKIGVILPTSGVYASLGEAFMRGIDLAVEDELDEEIDGREVEVLKNDSGFDPNTGADIAREYIEDEEVDFIAGPLSSAVGEAIKPIIDRAGTATWVNINAASKTIVSENCSPYHVRVSYNSYTLTNPMGQWVYENRGQEAVIGYLDYSFGQQMRADFGDSFEEAGGTIVDEIASPIEISDFAPVVSDISDSGADVLFASYTGSTAVNFLQAASEFGLFDEMAITGYGLVEWSIQEAAGDSWEGAEAIAPYALNREIPANEEYIELFQERYDDIPFGQDAFAYDGIKLINDAVVETGSTAPEEVIPFMRGYEIPDSPRGYVRVHPESQDATHDVPLLRANGPGEDDIELVELFEQVESPTWSCDVSGTFE